MIEPLVTVVLPIYNVEKQLKCCVDSVLGQSYHNLEVILVDDGSPDSCPVVCDEYDKKDSRIKVIHKQNAGLGMARNTGIDYATGEYICFFDSDDFISSDTIEKCVAAILETSADLVVFGHDNVNADGEVLSSVIPSTPKQVFEGEEILKKLLPMSLSPDIKTGEEWNLLLSAWNKLYSLDLIRQCGWRFVSEREIISEDFYSLTEFYGYARKVCIVPCVFYHYRVNESSLSRVFRPDRVEKIQQFYRAMVALSRKMGEAELLEQPIKVLTFGLIIGAMKQCVAANLLQKEKKSLFRSMVCNPFIQELVGTTNFSGANTKKKLLYFSLKKRWTAASYLFVLLRIKKAI